MNKRLQWLLVLVLMLCGVTAAYAADNTVRQQKFISLDNKVQSIKQEAIDIGKEIALLEEQLLFPPNTQFLVYVSADVDETFKLMQIMLKVGDRQAVNYMYDVAEQEALLNGGIHQLYKGNLAQGKHKLEVTYMGMIDKRMVRKQLIYDIVKGKDTASIQLQISGKKLNDAGSQKKEPSYTMKEWN